MVRIYVRNSSGISRRGRTSRKSDSNSDKRMQRLKGKIVKLSKLDPLYNQLITQQLRDPTQEKVTIKAILDKPMT